MAGLLGRRILGSILLIIASSFLVFSLIYIAPGDPINILLGGRNVDQATRDVIRQSYNLDQPFLVQYALWVGNVLHGNLGQSIALHGTPVSGLIASRVLPTLELALYASLLVALFGLLLGVLTAVVGVAGSTRRRASGC